MKKIWAFLAAAMILQSTIASAQSATGHSRPGRLGKPAATEKDTRPPVISLTEPTGAAELRSGVRGLQIVPNLSGEVIVRGTVEDDQNVNVLSINGQNISLSGSPTRKNFGVRLKVPEAGGAVSLTLVAYDKAGNTAQQIYEINGSALDVNPNPNPSSSNPSGISSTPFNSEFSELQPIRQDQAFAVIIGVANYADPMIPTLRYTVNDAQAVYELLTDPQYGGFKKENVKLLLDQQATVQNIKSAIGSWLPKVTPEDATVVIFFAGHGAPEQGQTYWLTHEAEINDLYASALSNDEIAQMLSRIKTERVLTFLDCCYSAATINRTVGTRDLITDDPFKEFRGRGRITITASDGKQLSVEDATVQHGIFTNRLIEGLKGRADKNQDGMVLVEEAWDYVKHKVIEDAKRLGHTQEPTFSGTFTSSIPLSRNPEAAIKRMQEDQKAVFFGLYRDGKIDGVMYERIKKVIEGAELSDLTTKRRALREYLDQKIDLSTFIDLFGK